jgi:hypothetical protein
MTAQASSQLQLISSPDVTLTRPPGGAPCKLAGERGARYGSLGLPAQVVPIDRNPITMGDDGPDLIGQQPRQLSKRLVDFLLGVQRIAIYVAECRSREQERVGAPNEIGVVRPGVESRAS